MGRISIDWGMPGLMIDVKLTGKITVADLMSLSDAIIEHVDASDHALVHLIIDETELEALPMKIREVVQAAKAANHPRMGWFLAYGNNNRMINFMAGLLSQITRMRHRRFKTREECIAFLRQIDVDFTADV